MAENLKTVINVVNVKKNYGATQALKDISFSVKEGEICSLLGPNGAGKTTTLNAITGLTPYDSGDIEVFDLKPGNKKLKLKIGVQFENSAFDKKIKVKELFKLYGILYSKKINIDDHIEQIGLTSEKNKYFGDLSQGWKQRVQIGIALIHDPEVLFFDEVSNGLDLEARRTLWDFILTLKNRNKTILISTHNFQEVEYLADSLLIISKGKIVASGSIKSVIDTFEFQNVIEVKMKPENLHQDESLKILPLGNRYLIFCRDVEKVRASMSENFVAERTVNLEDIYLYNIKRDETECE